MSRADYTPVATNTAHAEGGDVENPLQDKTEGGNSAEGPKDDGEMLKELKFLDIKGKSYSVTLVPKSSTVRELKVRLEEVSSVPVELQRLIYSGRELKSDNQTLGAIAIQDGNVIHLFPRSPKPPMSSVSDATPEASHGAEAPAGVASGGRAAHLPARTEPGAGASAVQLWQFNELEFAADFELQDARRRVKLLACLLLVISCINFANHMIFLFNDMFTASLRDMAILCIRSAVDALGIYVGSAGVKGSNNLDPTTVRTYCYGLALLGSIYILNEFYVLVVVAVQGVNPALSMDDYPRDDEGTEDSPPAASRKTLVTQVLLSLMITVSIWSICFYRAFRFNRALLHSRQEQGQQEAVEPRV